MQLNKALVGFLTHTGYAHGGNGYEGIAFLIEQFKGSGLDGSRSASDARHRPAGAGGARRSSSTRSTRRRRRPLGSLDIAKLPGVNHPVFKDKPVNHDPREVFIAKLFEERGECNVFHALLPRAGAAAVRRRRLAQRLLRQHRRGDRGAAAEDAVAAATGRRDRRARLETAAFTIFLYPRMLGCAAEIDDHLNRGRNMDTRTPASACKFVA